MRDVPTAVDEAFFSGQRTRELPFCVNDSVEVLLGPDAGQVGAVISVESIRPEVILLIELGTGREVVVRAEGLRRREEAG
jgi:ribosomal protein L24